MTPTSDAGGGTPPPPLDLAPADGGRRRLTLRGRLDADSVGPLWRAADRALATDADLLVDASGVSYCDVAGVAFLLHLRHRLEGAGRRCEVCGLAEPFVRLQEMLAPAGPRDGAASRPAMPIPEMVGRATLQVVTDIRDLVVFIGEVAANLGRLATRRQRLRWKDTFLVAEAAGLRALPVVCLMGLILGLILAFQGAVPLRRYGGEMLVADMVVLAMFREMGPLFTAIILAARSSSAFAAELGTMKINEEVDALRTMGLDPVPFLALPRIVAGVITVPMLTVFMNLMGLVGGGVVFLSMGFTLRTYLDRLMLRGSAEDLLGGLFRSLVFGVLVAGIGCLQGLRTGSGARAVGESTTRSVVSAIVAIIIADGLLAVVYYALDI